MTRIRRYRDASRSEKLWAYPDPWKRRKGEARKSRSKK